jgi:hypothetical protein
MSDGALVTQAALEVLRCNAGGGRVSQAAVEILRTDTWGSRTTQIAVEVLALFPGAGAHVSQVAVETLRTNTGGAHLSQAAVEVLRSTTAGARISQAAVEILRLSSEGVRLTQATAEVLRTNTCGARATQAVVEVLRQHHLGSHVSQAAVEVLRLCHWPAYVTQLAGEALRMGGADARATQLVGEALRTGDGLGRVTALVAEVLRTNAPAGQHSSSAIRPWPFEANAIHDITERYGYLSEVLRARNGAEQRRLLRETAGGGLSFTCTLLTPRELQYASALVGTLIGQQIGVPEWQYAQRLSIDCPPGTTDIPADTAGVPFYQGGTVMLWQSPWLWEIFEVATAAGGHLATVAPLESGWLANATVNVPLVAVYLEQREELKRLGFQAGDYESDFEIPAFFPEGLEDVPAATQYLGYDVLELIPDRPGTVPEGVTRAHETLDTGTGERWSDVLEAAPVGDRPFHWPCFSRIEALAQRAWLDRRKGVVLPFWVPTWEPDLTLAADAAQSAETITIQRIEYAGLVWPGSYARRHLAVYASGVAASYHYVSAAVDSGGETETLTITPPLPVAWPAATTKISFLRFCRLQEAFNDRRWKGGTFCVAEIPYTEVPKEAPIYGD